MVELLIAITVMAIGIGAIVAGFASGILAVSRASQTSTAGTLADSQMEAYRALPYSRIITTAPADSTYMNDTALTGQTRVTDAVPSLPATTYDSAYCGYDPNPPTPGPMARELAVGSSVNAPSITLKTNPGVAGLVPGTPIRIGTGAGAETASIASISFLTLTLQAPLAKSHVSGDQVYPVTCVPVQPSITGPDRRSYRVDSFITWDCAVGTLSTTSPYSAGDPGCLDAGNHIVSRPVKRISVVIRDAATTSKSFIRETSTFDQAT